MDRSRRGKSGSSGRWDRQHVVRKPGGDLAVAYNNFFSGRRVLSAGLVIVVLCAVVMVHWPALSARAISFDDNQYLLDNYLVQNPGWASAHRFLLEITKPSTVRGYYQPLAMISLMLDYAMGGRPDNLLPFHLTSLCLHAASDDSMDSHFVSGRRQDA